MSNLKKSIAFGLSLMSGMSVVAPTITVFAATEKEVKVDAELQKCLDAVVFEDAEAIASTIEEFKKSVEEEAKLISKGEKSSAELKISLDNIDLEKDAVAGEEVKYIDETDKANLVLTPYKNEEDKVVGYILKMTRTGLGEKIDEKIAELKARYTDEYIASNYDEETQEKVKEELTKQIENLLNATEENLEQIYQEAVDTLEEFKNKLDVLKD